MKDAFHGTRKDAALAGAKRFYTGKPCIRGHLAIRYVSTGGCSACLRENVDAIPKAKLAAQRKARRALNGEQIRAKDRAWREANPEKVAEYRKRHAPAIAQWKRDNKDKFAATVKRYMQTPKGRAKSAEKTRRRQAALLLRTPKWVNVAELEVFYREAVRLTLETGILHHVDHIVPLQGRSVSGLHVPANLRVIPAAENQAKWNKFDPLLALAA